MRKDMFFSNIIRGGAEKTLKWVDIANEAPMVLQILTHPEALSEDQMVVFVRKRQVDTRTYGEAREMIFEAGQYPTIEDLKEAIIKFEGLDIGPDEIDLAKYFPQDFRWLHMTKETIDEHARKKKKKGGKKGAKRGLIPFF